VLAVKDARKTREAAHLRALALLEKEEGTLYGAGAF